MKHIRNVFYLFLFTLIIVSCNIGLQSNSIDNIESVMEQSVDSAYSKILYLQNNGKLRSAKEDLLIDFYKIRAQYRLGLKFDDISIFEKVVGYFEEVSVLPKLFEALYYEGLAYKDMGVYSSALDCFNRCITIFDQDAEIDLILCSKVYSQMSDIFHQQRLPEYELESLHSAISYALKGGDSILALQYEEFLVKPYDLLGNYDSIITISERCASKYYNYGYKKLGDIKQQNALYGYLVKKDYQKARRSIDLYEQGSGFFDAEGNIIKGKEIYYYKKGLYCLGVNDLDSASYYFRKLLAFKEDLNNRELAYRGLLLFYNKVHNIDSIGKYSRLYCETNDSVQIKTKSDEILRLQAVYNYSIHKQKAEALSHKVAMEHNKSTVYAIVSIFIFILSILGFALFWQIKKKEEQLHLAVYNEKMNCIERLEQDRIDQHDLIIQLKNEAMALKVRLDEFNSSAEIEKSQKALDTLIEEFHRKVKMTKMGDVEILDSDWRSFFKYTEACNSKFSAYLYRMNLSKQEMKVALLIGLLFTDDEICRLLNSSGSSFCNCKTRINTKLFKTESAKNLRQRLIKLKNNF